MLDDQFTFRPTDSTTCALFRSMNHINLFLETNSYVTVLCIDFSKAFDIVDHEILLSKLINLGLLPVTANWAMLFLMDRNNWQLNFIIISYE